MKTITLLITSLLALGFSTSAFSDYQHHTRLKANLSGAEQVRTTQILNADGNAVTIPILGPLVTGAYGKAHFKLSPDGSMLHYRLEAMGFTDDSPLFMAHIHLGTKGANGPVMLWLYGNQDIFPNSPRDDGEFTGSISGVLTSADLNPLPDFGIETFADAVANIMHGNTYVNLHTVKNGAGELRGQIHKKMKEHSHPPFGRKFPFGKNSPFDDDFPF